MTKDVDFDCPPSVPADTLERQIQSAMSVAAKAGGVREAEVQTTKKGEATIRVRLSGKSPSGDTDVRWVAEASRRILPPDRFVVSKLLVPPHLYGLSPVPVTTYSTEAMLASKVSALQSDNRNVPRDIYDLTILINSGDESPRPLWSQVSGELLREVKNKLPGKIQLIDFARAEAELLPYLAPADRERFTQTIWEGMQADVAMRIDSWIDQELQSRLEESHDPQIKF